MSRCLFILSAWLFFKVVFFSLFLLFPSLSYLNMCVFAFDESASITTCCHRTDKRLGFEVFRPFGYHCRLAHAIVAFQNAFSFILLLWMALKMPFIRVSNCSYALLPFCVVQTQWFNIRERFLFRQEQIKILKCLPTTL